MHEITQLALIAQCCEILVSYCCFYSMYYTDSHIIIVQYYYYFNFLFYLLAVILPHRVWKSVGRE